jgi:hypothetical protein
MNKQVMAIAVCLALQPVVSLGAETMIQPGVKERDSKQSFEIQRGRAVPEHLAKSCIPMRPGNPNGVASQEANKPGSVRNDCEPMTQPRETPDGSRLVHTFPDGARLYATNRNGSIQKYSAIDQRGRALKVEIVQNPPKGMILGPNDSIERGEQRAEEVRARRQAAFNVAIDQAAAKKCIVKILAADGDILYWDLAASGMGCPKG